jgi:tetratricopeptide (TPR) repeat protein
MISPQRREVRTKRHALLLILLFVTSSGLFLGLRRRPGSVGPKPVAMGKTMTQLLPDETGQPQAWKITKWEIPREKLPDLVLPKPAPRTTLENARTDSARALDAEALEAWKHGDIQGALEKFEAAVKADPDDPEPHSDYGRLLTLMTDYQHAMLHLEKAAQLRPGDPQVWLDLAVFYERNQLFERAAYAKQKADQLTGGQNAIRDENGFWIFEGTTFP